MSESTMPTVGMFLSVHSLIALKFSDGLRKMTTSGTYDPSLIGSTPKLFVSKSSLPRIHGDVQGLRIG